MPTLNRRQFIASATAAAVAARAASAAEEPERKTRLGLIGCGGYGNTDADAALKSGKAEIVALCDVDSAHLSKTADRLANAQGRRPRTYKLYEDMLNAGELDAVIIATPPHWHALPLIAAVERGLDVYCEKPLAYDVREGRAMVDAARKSGRIVQVGFQRRKAGAIVAVAEHIRAGNAGRIVMAEAQIHYTAGTRSTTPTDPPPTLDWDLWCGPAPKIPYCEQVGHVNWRLEKTTGHGHLVDWGIHLVDAFRFIMRQPAPRAVQAAGGLLVMKDRITTPDTLNVSFEFEDCPLYWRHRIWGAAEYTPALNNGLFLYGENETIFVTDDTWEIIPRGRGREREVRRARTDAGGLHMADFLDAVRTRRQPACTIEDGYRSTTAVQLAMIAYETGAPVAWDATREQITNNAEGAKLLKREYRAPWQHPWRG